MPHRSSFLALVAPALLLAGCGGTMNRGLESVHQPVVSRTDYVFDVNTTNQGLAPGEARRLDGWMASLGLGYGDRVAIDDPSPYDHASRDAIASTVAHYGLLLSDAAPVTAAPLTPGTVRVVISRMQAAVPNCPDFSRQQTPNLDEHTSSNHGCSINSNLAAMVARPEDLVRGQTGTEGSDPAIGTKAIQTFRKAPNTGAGDLKAETTGGSSS